MEATMALSERMRQEQAERARSVTPEVADALRKLTEHSKALMEALADLARQGAYEFKKAPGREFVDRSEAMRNVLRIRDAHTLMHHSARAALVAAGRNAGVDVPRVRDADEPLPPEVLVDAQTDRAHPPEQLKPCTRGVGGTPNDLRQVREDSQGLGEPGRLSPTSGVAADPAPQERELVGWQFRYVFEDQGNRRAAWGCVLQGAPSFTSGYRSYNGWQRRYFHEVRRVYADPVEPYVEDPHHKPDTSGVPEGHASARNFPGADDVAGVAPVEATSTKPCPECSGGNPGLLDDGSGGFSTCDECGGTGTIGVDASRGGEQ
jgi:hypothetical protein